MCVCVCCCYWRQAVLVACVCVLRVAEVCVHWCALPSAACHKSSIVRHLCVFLCCPTTAHITGFYKHHFLLILHSWVSSTSCMRAPFFSPSPGLCAVAGTATEPAASASPLTPLASHQCWLLKHAAVLSPSSMHLVLRPQPPCSQLLWQQTAVSAFVLPSCVLCSLYQDFVPPCILWR